MGQWLSTNGIRRAGGGGNTRERLQFRDRIHKDFDADPSARESACSAGPSLPTYHRRIVLSRSDIIISSQHVAHRDASSPGAHYQQNNYLEQRSVSPCLIRNTRQASARAKILLSRLRRPSGRDRVQTRTGGRTSLTSRSFIVIRVCPTRWKTTSTTRCSSNRSMSKR